MKVYIENYHYHASGDEAFVPVNDTADWNGIESALTAASDILDIDVVTDMRVRWESGEYDDVDVLINLADEYHKDAIAFTEPSSEQEEPPVDAVLAEDDPGYTA